MKDTITKKNRRTFLFSIGDMVATNSRHGSDVCGVVVGIFDPIVVWKAPSGQHDCQDADALYLVAKGGSVVAEPVEDDPDKHRRLAELIGYKFPYAYGGEDPVTNENRRAMLPLITRAMDIMDGAQHLIEHPLASSHNPGWGWADPVAVGFFIAHAKCARECLVNLLNSAICDLCIDATTPEITAAHNARPAA